MTTEWLNKKKTDRGFSLIEFKDRYNCKCNIQKSSLATEDAIWFGIDAPEPHIMASTVQSGATGWVPYAIPDNVLITTRMHLTRKQVQRLLPILKYFVEHGEIADPDVGKLDDLVTGALDTCKMAIRSFIRFEGDLNVSNHALVGEIHSFVEFFVEQITKKRCSPDLDLFIKICRLLKKVRITLEQLENEHDITDDVLASDVFYYLDQEADCLSVLKEEE